MLTSKGQQCDVCDKFAFPGDEFFKFVIPMVAAKSDPKIPAPLLACPSCREKLNKAMIDNGQMTVLHNIDALPPGRLKRILMQIQNKQSLRIA
jgi:hypothetical protein